MQISASQPFFSPVTGTAVKKVYTYPIPVTADTMRIRMIDGTQLALPTEAVYQVQWDPSLLWNKKKILCQAEMISVDGGILIVNPNIVIYDLVSQKLITNGTVLDGN